MTGTMTHLFERWNAYEPNRCRFVPFAAMVKLGGIEREIAHSVTLLPVEHALLLAAVIEAIEARGLLWSLRNYDGHTGKHMLAGVEDSVRIADSPAAALLGAYLAALEAEADQ